MKITKNISITPSDFERIDAFIVDSVTKDIGNFFSGNGILIDVSLKTLIKKPIFISSTTGNGVVDVVFEGVFLNPQPGDVFAAKVVLKVPGALIVKIIGCIDCIIKTDKSFIKGAFVNVVIKETREIKNSIKSIGLLV